MTTKQKQGKSKGRQKRLTIYNTDRYYNVNLLTRQELEDWVKVSSLVEKDIEANMDELEAKASRFILKDNQKYRIFHETYANDRVISKVAKHGGQVDYYTDTIVPYYVLKDLANNTGSQVTYGSRPKFDYDDVDNVALSFMACPVVIDVPVVLPDISPYDILFMLHPLKTNVDHVNLSFPRFAKGVHMGTKYQKYYHLTGDYWEVKPEYKFRYFKYVQDSLSIWAMNIYIVCDSQEDYQAVKRLVLKDKQRRSPGKKVGDTFA